MQVHQSILEFAGHRYLKVALLVSVAAIAAYVWPWPDLAESKSYGNTWLGLTLGWVAAAMVLWLMLLGIRKRRYASIAGSVQGQTSAHVYLGVTLLLIGALHAGFEFGWNLHTFVYVFMAIVIFSGMYGVFAYLWYPRKLTEILGDDSIDSLLDKIDACQTEAEQIARVLPTAFNRIVDRARGSRFGGSFRRRLAGNAVFCPTRTACSNLPAAGRNLSGEQETAFRALLQKMGEKHASIVRVRNAIRMHALLEVWLYVHVPMSFALLAALIAHIVSVFYYNN